jgi:hypothetical protein
MGYLKERVSYLRGLAEGMQLNEATNEGKLLKAMIEVMDDISLAIEDVEEIQDQLGEQVDTIDEDLAEIEKIIFDDECEDNDDDACFGEIDCPHCGESVEICEDMIDDETDSFECPHCHKDIEIEWDCSCEECGDHKHE